MKHQSRIIKVFVLGTLLTPWMFSQERILVGPESEIYLQGVQQSALKTFSMINSVPDACPTSRLDGYTTDGSPPEMSFGAKWKDVMAMWFVAPVTGWLDTLFLPMNPDIHAYDSTVIVRIHRSNVYPGRGPGDGIYPPPCIPWGYYVTEQDTINGITPFPETDSNATWVSTVIADSPSFPLMGEKLWGPYAFRVSPDVNTLALDVVSPGRIYLQAGEPFFVSMEINAPTPYPPAIELEWTRWWASTTHAPIPGRLWKFYKHDAASTISNYCGTPYAPAGWIARASLNSGKNEGVIINMWYTMSIQSDLPPSIVSYDKLTSDTTVMDRPLGANIQDCNPLHPADVGIASVMVLYTVNNLHVDTVQMINVGGPYWETQIPGQPGGSVVSYQILAADNYGLSTITETQSYSVLSSTTLYYNIDTTVADSGGILRGGTDQNKHHWIDLADSGITISDWVISNVPYYPQDDGTSPPIDLGGAFEFFGAVHRYAFIGVNGAICLSATSTEQVNLNTGYDGFSCVRPFPDSTLPPYFIGALYNDIVVDPPILGGIGQGTVKYSRLADQFIIQWEGVGTFFQTTGTFEIILDRSDNSVTFIYRDVEGSNLLGTAVIGLQGGSSEQFVLLNSNGEPSILKPRNYRVVKFTPNPTVSLKGGWNLISLPFTVPDPRISELFPSASLTAYSYQGSYLRAESLDYGVGYWLKSGGAQVLGAEGPPLVSDTVNIRARWNIIGSIGTSVPVDNLISDPPGMVISGPYAYEDGYYLTDTIRPGKGYFVKSSQDGRLILSSTPPVEEVLKNRVVVVHSDELPPAPPGENIPATRVIPQQFGLRENYPNPFNSVTVLTYEIPRVNYVVLKVLNVLGQEIATLVDGFEEPGYKSIHFDGGDLPSGVYYYRLQAGSFVETKKMLLIR